MNVKKKLFVINILQSLLTAAFKIFADLLTSIPPQDQWWDHQQQQQQNSIDAVWNLINFTEFLFEIWDGKSIKKKVANEGSARYWRGINDIN